jgi:hypothetical protein
MKKPTALIAFLVMLGCAAAAAPASLIFRAPNWDDPVYRLQFPFQVTADKTRVKEIFLNGEKVGHFLIFKDGKHVPAGTALENGVYDIVIDYAWAGGKSYRITLVIQSENSPQQSSELAGNSPRQGGIPGGKEGFYRVYKVENEAGIERKAEAITLILTAPRSEIEDSALVIFDGSTSVPYEILERRESSPPEKVAANYPATLTYKIALSLDAAAGEKKMLLVLKGKGLFPDPGRIVLLGQGLGKTVRTPRLVLELSAQSGQVNTIESLEAGVKLYNKAGVIHWNPDVFVPGIAWDHSFDWNPPPAFEEKSGASFYLNSRKGPLPRVKDVFLEVKYTVAADAPYFLSETRMSFLADLGVIAVRNDEMVLFKELFDSLVYRDKARRIVQMPLAEKSRVPFGLAHVAPDSLDWVGLTNTKEGYGFFSLRLAAAAGNLEIPGEFHHKAGTYFYAPADGNYVYWVRPLIYTWGDFFTNNLFTSVPKGSYFYEKNAYIVLRLEKDWPDQLDSWHKRLTSPLRVF